MVFTIANCNGRLPRLEEPPIASTSSRVPLVGTFRPTEQRHFDTTWDRQRCRSVTQKSRKQEREAQQIQAEEEEEVGCQLIQSASAVLTVSSIKLEIRAILHSKLSQTFCHTAGTGTARWFCRRGKPVWETCEYTAVWGEHPHHHCRD